MEIKSKDSNERRHEIACQNDEEFYLDIETGYKVLTSTHLKKRGKCCGLGCRHCPFKEFRKGERKGPILVRNSEIKEPIDSTSVLFWSGGKDCFIAFLNYKKSNPNQHVTFLNTFDPDLNMIGLHNISVTEVKKQAKYLKIDLLMVPITKEKEYTQTIKEALEFLKASENYCKIKELVTGDLHLQTIIQWREKKFGDDYKFCFPNLNMEYDSLIDILEKSGVKCEVCSSEDESIIMIGEIFNLNTFTKLPKNTSFDRFGENGEFHTVIKFE